MSFRYSTWKWSSHVYRKVLTGFGGTISFSRITSLPGPFVGRAPENITSPVSGVSL